MPPVRSRRPSSYVGRGGIKNVFPNLITQDNDAPRTRRKLYLGTDNYEAGKAVGKLVKEAMPEGGTIAIFVGQPDPINAKERRQGVLDELAGKKDAKGD